MAAPLQQSRRIQHINGSVDTTGKEVKPDHGGESSCIIIQGSNTPGSGDLQVSFDGGKSYYTVFDQKPALTVFVNLNSIWVKASSGTQAYEILWMQAA